MNLSLQALTEPQCKEICTWRYPEPYANYNWSAWDALVAAEEEFADPTIREAQYAAVVRSGDTQQSTIELIGYVQYFPLAGVTRLGLGLRPDLCGLGLGQAVMEVILEEAFRRNPDNEIDLEVLVWNARAEKAYSKAGFVRTDEYERMTPTGMDRFYCMVYQGNKALRS